MESFDAGKCFEQQIPRSARNDIARACEGAFVASVWNSSSVVANGWKDFVVLYPPPGGVRKL